MYPSQLHNHEELAQIPASLISGDPLSYIPSKKRGNQETLDMKKAVNLLTPPLFLLKLQTEENT